MRDTDSPSIPSRDGIGPATIFLVGLWFAFLVGGVEVVGLLVQKHGLGQVIQRSGHYPWMVPIGYLVLFAVPTGVVAAGSPLIPARHRLRLSVFLLGGMAVLSVLATWLYGHLHNAALLVLLLGAAVRISVVVSNSEERFLAMVRRSSLWAGALLLLVLIGFLGAERLGNRRQFHHLADARAGAPNVLLLILDTVRASSLSLYGYHRETTPNLERWAANGVVFDQAIAPSSWTLPSHVSMFTGVPPNETSADWEHPFDGAFPTLADVLGAEGYATGGFVANRNYTTIEHGIAKGFRHYEDYLFSLGELVRTAGLGKFLQDRWTLRPLVGSDQPIGRKTGDRVSDSFLEWLDDVGDRPYFAFLNYYDAHDPYLPPGDWKDRFAPGREPSRLSPIRRYSTPWSGKIPESVIEDEVASYDGAIAYLDDEIDRLLASLEQRGGLENTIVVVTSDHGELFGEHDLFRHGYEVYAPSLHVPLMILGPGLPHGRRVAQSASLVDLPATLLDLAGASNDLPGASLAPLWSPGADSVANRMALSYVRKSIRQPPQYPSSQSELGSAWYDGWHYIRQGEEAEFLFNVRSDPDELENLIEDPAAFPVLRRMRPAAPRDAVPPEGG